MLRHFLTLTVAAALIAPLTASAQTAPTPPATPATPAPEAPKKPATRVGGTITAVDAVKKTITFTHHKKEMTATVADDAKIYKAGERGKNAATGAWTDLTAGTRFNAHFTGDETAPTLTEIHIQAPKTSTVPVPAAPATPAAP